MESENVAVAHCVPWNKGKLTGQKPPLKLRESWAIRIESDSHAAEDPAARAI